MSRTVDIGLYRAQWKLHDFGDLLIRFVLYVPEHDAGPVLGPELSDSLFDGRSQLAGLELLEW